MRLLASIFNVAIDGEDGEKRIAGYLAALADLSDAEWSTAVARAVREEKFLPVPARLRELAGPTNLSTKSEAAIAFRKLFDEPRRNGLLRYSAQTGERIDGRRVLEILGPVAYQAFVAVGAAHKFDEASESGRPFLERDFIAAYVEASAEYRRTGELPAAEEIRRLAGPVRELVSGAVREFPKR